jgi:hypothetical protein
MGQVPEAGLDLFGICTLDAVARRKDLSQPLLCDPLVPSTVVFGITILSIEIQPSHDPSRSR